MLFKYCNTLALVVVLVFLFKKNNIKLVYSDLLERNIGISLIKNDTLQNQNKISLTDNLRKIVNTSSEYAILLFLISAILPFLILSVFVHPCWDDFDYSEISYYNGFTESQYIWYYTWSGRYFSTAVLSGLNPLLFRSITGYKILTLLYILFFIVSVYFLIKEITNGQISKKKMLLSTLAFSYLFVLGLPSAGLALFWLPSTVIYQLANILTIVLITLLVKYFRQDGQKKYIPIVILICLLIFALEGCNEVSMITSTLFFVLIFIVNTIKEKKISRHLLVFALVSVVSFLIMYAAPGNNARLASSPDSHQLLFSLKNSVIDLLNFIRYRIYNLPLLIVTVIFISFYSKNCLIKKSGNITKVVNPFYSTILFMLILFTGIFVSRWSLGTSTPFRTLNVIFFLFLTGWFINIIFIMNYLYVKKKAKINILPKYAYVILCLAVFFSFLRETSSIKEAYKDLIYGTASKFDSELKERYQYIYSDNSDTCKVKSLTEIPKSYFYSDIGSDPDANTNRMQSSFFNKKFIIRNK